MADEFLAKVWVTPPAGQENQVASRIPKEFTEEDLTKISILINRSVIVLQNQLKPAGEVKTPSGLALSELEISFGIELEGETKIPLIGPFFQMGVKAGATFQVQIKLSKEAQ